MYKVICTPNHTDADHLALVKASMIKLGAPTIHAVADRDNGQWLALEGSHRVQAAKDLGLTVNIINIGYLDELTDDDLNMMLDDDFGIKDGDYYSVADMINIVSHHDAKAVIFN